MCSNDELLFNIFKNKQIKEILVTVEEDELFTRVKSGDKLEKIISENLYNEMDVHEIRKSLGNDFIIKSSKCETVIYDDMPLFSIPGKIYSEDINPENETKNEIVQNVVTDEKVAKIEENKDYIFDLVLC